jgi:gluconate 5-dehydrogenase
VSKSPFDLTGRCALITGSASGLGLSYAKALAAAGAAIVMNDIDPERLAKSAAAMRANGCTVHESAFNVADEAAVKAAFAKLDAGNVAVHILVNNAGIQFRKPLLELEARDWQRVMDINLTAAFLVAKEAAGRMVARGEGGKIINIGSLTSELARATTGPYTTAKGGIKMLSRAMTAEWAEHGISVNTVGPGYILTEMNKALIENRDFDAWVKARTPARRWGTPEDVAGTIVFLASPASDFVTGQMIFVDGGIASVL